MPVIVPSFAVKWITAASVGSGLSYNIVACQVNAESGFNANAVSSAGAEGPYQFLPSTFYSVWHGSPFSWQDSTVAYGIYMSGLLREFHGNVRNALAAYNAGPGNIAAGFGYADGIIACAGGAGQVSSPGSAASGALVYPATPNVQPDDWSWWIVQSSRHVKALADSARIWAPYIARF